MRPVRVVLLIVVALYIVVLATGLGVFDRGPSGPATALAYEYSTTITTSTSTSSSTSTTTTTTPTITKPGKGCGDKNHLHERRFECKVVVSGTSAREGNSGTKTFTFAVTLSGSALAPVSVDFATADGTATAGSDYEATSGTLTIPTGQNVGYVRVTVDGDATPEANETFYVKLSNPSANAYLGNTQATGTISNDD